LVHTESLKTHIEPLVEAGGAHLVELVFHPQGRRRMLEVYADTENGITADTLAALSRSIGEAIDENGWITESYHLVVSSPGLDRPVRHPWQFQRHLGRTVTLSIIEGDEKQNITGKILDAEEEQLVISLGEGAKAIPYDRIENALIQAML
jgi:ribosome maturation factor RimP